MHFLILMPLLAALKVAIQGRVVKNKCNCVFSTFFVNGLIFFSSAIMLALIFVRNIPTLQDVICGSLISIGNIMLQVGYAFAFKNGSVSLATTINNFNIVMPLLLGLMIYNEQISALGYVGLIFLAFAFVLLSYKKGDSKKNLRWFVFTVIAFFGSGFSNSVMSVLAHNSVATSNGAIMFCSYIISSFICFFVTMFTRKTKTKSVKCSFSFIVELLAIGTILGIYNVSQMKALTLIDTVVLFPIVGILTIFLVSVFDIIFFGQRFTKRQIAGIVLGAISVGLLNI